ncbi:hypothetical protein [Shinella sp.]|uniref:hypothetical protein n=1 Tax=Shinella sp. TaxID=1870904 RepID=UPI0028A109A2|nr:hypothetical protein [Shinella sp.]
MSWKTINAAKLESEIDKRSAVLEALRRGRDKLHILELAEYNRVLSEHNALVAVYNSLQ